MQPKTVLITGCSSGIGRATAEAFRDEGWQVYATARDPADIQQLGEAGCELATLDVTDRGDVDRVVDRMIEAEGRIDCLVNNAGYGQLGPIEDVPAESVREQFEVNVYGPHRLTRAVLPQMRRQGDGTIVNVSSAGGRTPFPGAGVYCGSKAALEAMTDALRAEVDGHGVDAVLVEPGPVDTGFTERAADEVDVDGGETTGVERSGAYEDFYDRVDDVRAFGAGFPGFVAPERVAAEIVDAAAATRPGSRYPVGPLAKAAEVGRFVPDRWRDRLFGLVDRL